MSSIKEYKKKEWLEEQYINLGKSQKQIAKECNCVPTTIGIWLRKYDLNIKPEAKKGNKYFCLYCGKEFIPHKRAKSIQKYCGRKCRYNAWASTKYGDRSKKDSKLRGRYGITIEKYEQLIKEKKYKCEICGKERKLYVDHSHKTDEIRGLLCRNCNSGLGFFKENKRFLKNAIIYLEDFENEA